MSTEVKSHKKSTRSTQMTPKALFVPGATHRFRFGCRRVPIETDDTHHGAEEASSAPVTYWINGREFDRVAYGNEAEDWRANSCPDCNVAKGEIHLLGCDIEECPSCGGQSITCECEYDDDEDGWQI